MPKIAPSLGDCRVKHCSWRFFTRRLHEAAAKKVTPAAFAFSNAGDVSWFGSADQMSKSRHNAFALFPRLSEMQLDDYYASYRLIAAYLTYLDRLLPVSAEKAH